MCVVMNACSDEIIEVVIRGKTYPVEKKGKGVIPCLVIGIGTVVQRSLSSTFSEIFAVYTSDLYWTTDRSLKDSSQMTMDNIIEDIYELAYALRLENFVLFGHSAYGIVAIEFAKKYPKLPSSVIMIGTPLNSNLTVAAQNNDLFDKLADANRKAIDAKRRAEVAQEDLTLLSAGDRFLREYIYRDAPRYWHIPDYDCSDLWKGIMPDKILEHFFSKLLPKVDVKINLETIQLPIFFAAGLSDFDCCPWVWKELLNLPPKMTINLFQQSGHWPQMEEPEIFDKSVKEWLSSAGYTI